MDTLHKLAGVTEASNNHAQPPQPVPERPPIPQDTETTAADARASRSSLPLNRRASHKSIRSSRNDQPLHGDADAPPVPSVPQTNGAGGSLQGSAASGSEEEEDDEYAWGPAHPCFPHPNPHCAPDSEEARNTRVIRVRRDWLAAGDLYPQYANLYPEILDFHVSDEDFRFLISNINARVKDAFDPSSTRAWIDSAMGLVTGYIWDDLGLTGAKRGVKALEAFVESWNAEKRAKRKEVVLIQPRKTGFMTLDFVVPDPGVDVVPESPRRGEGDGEGDDGIGPAE